MLVAMRMGVSYFACNSAARARAASRSALSLGLVRIGDELVCNLGKVFSSFVGGHCNTYETCAQLIKNEILVKEIGVQL